MSQVGRISGPLLESNLVRNGIDLSFRNTLNDTRLLYLNVNDGRIGVNTATTTKELEVSGTTQTIDLISNNGATTPGFQIENSTFEAFVGDIELNAQEAIVMPTLENGTIKINDNIISTTISNANIDITPHGTGRVEVVNDLNVYGNIYTPGNITLGGSITLGDALAQDTVDFNADVTSIVPDVTNTYSLGSFGKRWNRLYTNLVNGQTVSVDDLTVGLIDYTLRQGQIFYVAQNGSDTNSGDHILAPFSSIKRALEAAADSNGNPVTVYVYPGDYEEETPLIVPANVSVIGADIRTVKVFPTSYTLSEDVFHLNDSSTISDLTVKDFYFDSNKGYAFRFAQDAVISNRSPYIQNVTVLTKGSNITVDDPLGFESGDAGRGAYIDGAELNAASTEASMLFHSVTMITPGVDSVTMTNGVRVEWLNSFTYYANRGLYAFNNSTGRIMQDGSTVGYGAEIRSIGSANVYGNYGAVADGSDCLMYLINHNFAYIGSGKNSSNDDGLIIQANEVVEENSGQIHYVTTDQGGNFRVGDNFFINFDTGSTSVNIDSLTADSFSGLNVTTGGNTTVVTGSFIETGNFRIRANTIDSFVGNIDLESASSITNLQNNTNVFGDLDLTGNLTFGGSLNLLGNQTSDILDFNVDFDQNFQPHQNLRFSLGSKTKQWLVAWLSRANIGDIEINDNFITTDISNADLELRANGTGNISITDSLVSEQDLDVSGTASLESLTINGSLTTVGNLSISESYTVPNLSLTQNITVRAAAQFEEILIDDNVITTTSTNTDLELRANGTGKVLIPNNDIELGQALSSNSISSSNDINVTTQVSFNEADVSDITIAQNFITTNNGNLDLQIIPNRNLVIPVNDVSLAQNLTVGGVTEVLDTNITGTLTHLGLRGISGNYSIGGSLTVDSVYLEDNFITTTSGNNNLELRAPTPISLTFDAGTSGDPQTQTLDGGSSGTFVFENTYDGGFASQETILAAKRVYIQNNDVLVDNNFTVDGTTTLSNTSIAGSLTHTGNRNQTGNLSVIGNLLISGLVNISSATSFENIKISGNVIQTTLSNADLELRAAGTGQVIVDTSVNVNNNLFASSITAGDIIIDQDLILDEIEIPPSIIKINDNYITTKVSNADLDLRANGTGAVTITNDAILDQDLTVNGISYLQNTSIAGNLSQTGSKIQDGLFSLTGDILNNGTFETTQTSEISSVRITNNIIETFETNADLELRANGSGNILIPSNDVRIISDLFVGSLNDVPQITVAGTVSLETLELSTDIQFFDNVITTTNSNSNLELRANGSGTINLQNLYFKDNTVEATSSNIILDPDQLVNINSTGAIKIPVGTTANWTPAIGDIRFNSTDGVFEARGNTSRITFNGVYSADRLTSITAHPTDNTIDFKVNGLSVGYIDSTGVYINGTTVDDISIQNNLIQTTATNSDLELRVQATSELIIEDHMSLRNNYFYNNDNGPLTISVTGNGYVKINDTWGAVIPYGTTAERPVSPETGEVRWNDDETYVEVWDGSTWIVAAGVAETITPDEFEDLLLQYTLIYG